MAAADETLANDIATLEADGTVFDILTPQVPRYSLVNKGPNSVWVRTVYDKDKANLARAQSQLIGEIEMEPGDTLPMPQGMSKAQRQCLAGQTAVMWYVPSVS